MKSIYYLFGSLICIFYMVGIVVGLSFIFYFAFEWAFNDASGKIVIFSIGSFIIYSVIVRRMIMLLPK